MNIIRSKKKLFTCYLFCFSLVFSTISAQNFKAGAAFRVITPDPLLSVSGGMGKPSPVKEKKGDLFARAVVLENNGKRIAIVSVDNLGWSAVLGNKSRALVKSIAPENIIIAATHTHSAPDAYGFPDETGKASADLKYLDFCVVQIAEAINEAVKNLEAATLKIAVDEAKGKIAYNYYAPQLYDPRCGVIQAISKNNKTIFTLVNYAVHPEVLGSNRGILSPDLCGPLYDVIEAKTGGMAIFLNGAQGGMVTADTRLESGIDSQGGKEANTWEECIRIGTLLGEESLRIIASAQVLVNPSIFCTSKKVEFPVESEMLKYVLKHSSLEYKFTKEDTVNTQVNLINIGPAQILTIPGEALPNIGYYLKRKMPTKMPFLFGLANDAFGYILTKEDFNSFKRYDYVSRTSLGEMTGDIYINEALKLIKENPKP
ncbi:hypothetical protein SAMN06298216_1546 [Spirosomataceae bacterium TFI 002]|nr:hypothetical protein SAMN06298216_1546 [Spirosomataceae bacterium TFI 002]